VSVYLTVHLATFWIVFMHSYAENWLIVGICIILVCICILFNFLFHWEYVSKHCSEENVFTVVYVSDGSSTDSSSDDDDDEDDNDDNDDDNVDHDDAEKEP